MLLPEFNSDGFLPAGDYVLALDELRSSFLVAGPADRRRYPEWDSSWRLQLVENLAILVKQLWSVRITDIFVDGSFAEDKEHPNDIDGYFVCDLRRFASGVLARELNRLEPDKIWTWESGSRKAAPGFPHLQLPM